MWEELYGAVFRIAGLFCHQLPERSFFVAGVQFPLCIRCAFLLIGASAAAVYIVARRPLPSIAFCLIMALPMAVELALTTAGAAEDGNTLRALTALAFGFFFLIGAMKWLASRNRGWCRLHPQAAARGGSTGSAVRSRPDLAS